MVNQETYRIRTNLGDESPINIPVSLVQEYNSFEILSLKLNTDGTYKTHTSNEGIVVGRVSTANNGLGIPNVRVSIFVPKGAYNQKDEEEVLYPFSSPTDTDGDRIRYNLLPSDSDVSCYQVIGTLPSKRRILDNETVCEVFEKYYKYTTVTNEAGDFMLSNIPVGKQRLHIDADLSDIGPFLSQKPYNMIDNLGIDKNKFDSTRQFKTSNDLDSLAQVISQNKSIYVYPYWGDSTENSSDMKITRTDLTLNYDFKTSAIFIGSVITDKQSNSIRQNCTPTESAGKMSEMITGPGRIEMIRKTVDGKIEQHRVKGDMLINDNGVWCYAVPMNLDYVRTDEFGNIIPTDDPNKGVPTRARVRFRITMDDTGSDEAAHKRCSYLVPNNPKFNDEKFLQYNDADYSFGSDTWDESFVDLMWNKVYTVKNYVPRFQKVVSPFNRKHTGIKMVNHFGDNNPFPYNSLTVKLNFLYRLICVIIKIFISLITFMNIIVTGLDTFICTLSSVLGWIPIVGKKIRRAIEGILIPCIKLDSDFCDDGVNKNVTYPGCGGCAWNRATKPNCASEQLEVFKKTGEQAVCTNNTSEVVNCVENQLAQQNEATSFNFANDWINGCLYMPLWYRKIKPKKSFFFGLFQRKAKDQWCSSDYGNGESTLKLANSCAHRNRKPVSAKNYNGEDITFHITKLNDNCGESCHKDMGYIGLSKGVIINRENIFGQKVWYYKAAEITTSLSPSLANEYEDKNANPMISKTLYATDIVLLGSMNDCDVNGIPKFFNYLKSSTYNMPTDILFSDTEIEYKFDENGKLIDQSNKKVSVSSGCDWGNKNEYGYEDGGLFYSIGCNSVDVNTESCINLRRICELGIGQDEMTFIENIDVENETGIGNVLINSENDKLNLDNLDYYLRPDGFISHDDIVDFNYRSMFATMNGNNLKTKINTNTGVKEYDFRHLYVDNFDGSLYEIMRDEQKQRENANYKYNYNLEVTNLDYLTFRMGDRPFFYDGESLVQSNKNSGPKTFTLPKYQNSFYFYFGLKEGKTAIDVFNEKYNGPCLNKTIQVEDIPYKVKPNSWCSLDSDINNTYNHKTFDGYLTLNLDAIPLPCTAILNSLDNNSVTYTITTYNGSTNIVDERICFYGNGIEEKEINTALRERKRYYFRYENPSLFNKVDTKNLDVDGDEKAIVSDPSKGPCVMIGNGSYNMFITDADGNKHQFKIKIDAEFLEFDIIERAFAQPNNVLKNTYRKIGGVGKSSPYNSVAKSPNPSNEKITIKVDATSIPIVERQDLTLKLVENNEGTTIPLNGTICIYNLTQSDGPLNNFIIEVEPYNKLIVNGKSVYVDEDFHDGEPTNTWYKVKMFNDHLEDKVNRSCTLTRDENGREYVIPTGAENPYFYFEEQKMSGGLVNRFYVIKCPKGDVDYRVRVTQLCKSSNGRYYKSQNFIEHKIHVAEPTPYKLMINDVDYDIIKNFNTGWTLNGDRGLQVKEIQNDGYGKPFAGVGVFENIKGWLDISDVNKNYNWSADIKKYGPNELTFRRSSDGQYALLKALEIKKAAEPIEPLLTSFTDPEVYKASHNVWIREYDEWKNGYLNTDGTRKSCYRNWDTVDSNERLGGCCGYQYVLSSAELLLNRLEFVKKMKSAFWIQNENEEKVITYNVYTDDNPHNLFTIYNPEMVSSVDESKHETLSEGNRKGERHMWKCVGEGTRTISGIKIPNITSFDNPYYGISEDKIRQNNYPSSYNKLKTLCYAQDNIAERSTDNGGISIKPPYVIACVNNVGQTKPTNLRNGVSFAVNKNNRLGFSQYKFGEVDGNAGQIKDGENEFFQFMLIDKLFSLDIIYWAYMSNMPFFAPQYEYDRVNDGFINLGEVLNMPGILSGTINNGITTSSGVVTDFKQQTIFDEPVDIETFRGDSEDSIPTRRCIKLPETVKEHPYKNYRFTDSIDSRLQYALVQNNEGEAVFIDSTGLVRSERNIYGSARFVLKSDNLNDTSIKVRYPDDRWLDMWKSPEEKKIELGEFGDRKLTMRIGLSNVDPDDEYTYYLFGAVNTGYIDGGAVYSNNEVLHPIDAFHVYRDENSQTLKRHCFFTDSKAPWDGSTQLVANFFHKNTTELSIREQMLMDKVATSEIIYHNSNGEKVSESKNGYGNTGVFVGLKHKPYFVAAFGKKGGRVVSPVYDFTKVYYVVGLVTDSSGVNYLRTALVYVLKKEGACGMNDDGYDKDRIGPYCKKPRNYYLTQFGYSIEMAAKHNEQEFRRESEYHEKLDFSNIREDNTFTNQDGVGDSYYKRLPDGTYEVHTRTSGTIEITYSDTKPNLDLLVPGKYFYNVLRRKSSSENKYVDKFVTINVTNDGEIEELDETFEIPTVKAFPLDCYMELTSEKGVYYKVYRHESQRVVKLDYHPKTPHFKRYSDKRLTNDEFKLLSSLFSQHRDYVDYYFRYYVTDVVGLRHRCALHKVMSQNEWSSLFI